MLRMINLVLAAFEVILRPLEAGFLRLMTLFEALKLLIDNRWIVPYNLLLSHFRGPHQCRVCDLGEEHQVYLQMMPAVKRQAPSAGVDHKVANE